MKTKAIALLEISVVLCSLFLVALPAVAAEQNQAMQKVSATEVTAASEDDYVLGIYGNANEDDTIDMRDLTYVKLIFFGKKPETELADAKYDGKINPLDFIQIKLIIVGKEKELTLVDSVDKTITVNMPIEKVVTCHKESVEMMRSLKATDKIVGVVDKVTKMKVFFPEFSGYPNVGSGFKNLDIEKILELQPDIVIHYAYNPSLTKDLQDKLDSANANIPVVGFDCYKPQSYVEEIKMLGYIFDKKEEAKKLIEFYDECMNTIKEQVEGLSDADKPKVYFEYMKKYYVCSKYTGTHSMIVTAGGNDIFSDFELSGIVDAEEVIKRDPEIIVSAPYPLTVGFSLDVGDTTAMNEAREEVMNRPELQRVTAVKSGTVYITTCSHGMTATRHFVLHAYLAKWFHPELFKDLDPKAIHQEYLTEFQGLDIDLDKQGVFVYHPDEHPDGQ